MGMLIEILILKWYWLLWRFFLGLIYSQDMSLLRFVLDDMFVVLMLLQLEETFSRDNVLLLVFVLCNAIDDKSVEIACFCDDAY